MKLVRKNEETGLIVSLVILIIGIALLIGAPLQAGQLDNFLGDWEGTCYEGNLTYPVNITIEDSGCSVVYPTLNCVGTLRWTRTKGKTAIFLEDIQSGNCLRDGIVTITKTGKHTAYFAWYDRNKTLKVQAKIKRISTIVAPQQLDLSSTTSKFLSKELIVLTPIEEVREIYEPSKEPKTRFDVSAPKMILREQKTLYKPSVSRATIIKTDRKILYGEDAGKYYWRYKDDTGKSLDVVVVDTSSQQPGTFLARGISTQTANYVVKFTLWFNVNTKRYIFELKALDSGRMVKRALMKGTFH